MFVMRVRSQIHTGQVGERHATRGGALLCRHQKNRRKHETRVVKEGHMCKMYRHLERFG